MHSDILYVSVFDLLKRKYVLCHFFSDLYSLPRYVLPLFGPQMHLLQVGVVLHQCVSYCVLAHVWYTP